MSAKARSESPRNRREVNAKGAGGKEKNVTGQVVSVARDRRRCDDVLTRDGLQRGQMQSSEGADCQAPGAPFAQQCCSEPVNSGVQLRESLDIHRCVVDMCVARRMKTCLVNILALHSYLAWCRS